MRMMPFIESIHTSQQLIKTDKAEFYLNRLKTEYPESPYLKVSEKVTFSEKSVTKVVNEEPKPNPKVTEKAVDKDYKFTVQAGAFTRKENALKLKTDLIKQVILLKLAKSPLAVRYFTLYMLANSPLMKKQKVF